MSQPCTKEYVDVRIYQTVYTYCTYLNRTNTLVVNNYGCGLQQYIAALIADEGISLIADYLAMEMKNFF